MTTKTLAAPSRQGPGARLPRLPSPLVRPGAIAVDRVRCVIAFGQRYLLVQHNTRRTHNAAKWGLPGGRLKPLEEPRVGLRREILEELRFRVPYVVELGDWRHCAEVHRVFGCRIGRAVEWFDPDEILAIGWFSYAAVVRLAEAGAFRTGFELAAITELRRRGTARKGSIELKRRPSKRVRGSRKTRHTPHASAPGASKAP